MSTPPTSLEILHVPGCPNLPALLERLRAVTDLPVTTREITTNTAAEAAGMHGSPTLLINGQDPFTTTSANHGMSCRIYRDEHGRAAPAPSPAQLRDALAAADRSAEHRPTGNLKPGAVLSAWRTRAQSVDPLQKAVHQAILRGFATTGQPPARRELATLTAGTARDVTSVLAALHELDAIRLTSETAITVAYPFSATPTRHRVRIDNRVEVYAMCAIDALGIAAMLNQDTHIDSTDPTTGQPVIVTTTAGQTSWRPAEAVVFLGAAAGGGPSADCCCEYLNFFANHAAATAWTTAHPHIPGDILTTAQAEHLGARLFTPLLATT